MLESIANWIINIISTLGYPGIVLTMAIESCLIPLPSEIIMPFSGFLASTGRFSLPLVIISGATGNLVGSLILYGIGYWGHERLVRRFIKRWGKWILISEDELDQTEKLLHKYKNYIILGSRVLPAIRTIISLPCGMAKLPLGRFIVLTFFGSLVWSALLAGIGYYLGNNWENLGPYFRKLDFLIVAVVAILIGLYIYYKLKKSKR